MLLRSSSAPLLKTSCMHHNSSRQNLNSSTLAIRSFSASFLCNPDKKITRTCSESNVRELMRPKIKTLAKGYYSLGLFEELKDEDEGEDNIGLSLQKASLDRLVMNSAWDNEKAVPMGSGHGSGGARGGSGRGSGGGGGGGWDSRHWNESMDGYYKEMIEAYPGDALLLGNYARFLKEICGDAVKAEEYCERAILAEPEDGNVLSLYGDLIWNEYKDCTRAQSYFDQAVQAAPDDCFVLASYAKFLWDAEEDEEVWEDEKTNTCQAASLSFRQGWPPTPPLSAAS